MNNQTISKLVKRYQIAKQRNKFGNINWPSVRKVFPNAIANEIVSVQPMTLPSGLLFYLDYSYGSGSQNNK